MKVRRSHRRKKTHLENFDDFVGDRHNPNHRYDEAHRTSRELGSGRMALVRKHEDEDRGGEACDGSG